MFGLTLTKILFTIALVAVIWRGFRWWQDISARRDRLATERAALDHRRAAAAPPGQDRAAAEETEACPICRTYVAASAAVACGRRDCPYPR